MATDYRIKKLEQLDSCVHYCDVGGHLWQHMTKGKRCKWQTPQGRIKFFSVCPPHRPKHEREEDYL